MPSGSDRDDFTVDLDIATGHVPHVVTMRISEGSATFGLGQAPRRRGRLRHRMARVEGRMDEIPTAERLVERDLGLRHVGQSGAGHGFVGSREQDADLDGRIRLVDLHRVEGIAAPRQGDEP